MCGKLGLEMTGTNVKLRRAFRRFQVTAHPYIRLNYRVSAHSVRRRYPSVCASHANRSTRDSLARNTELRILRDGATRKATILN